MIFVGRYVRGIERHPIAGGYGRWLNPLGQWDWWDLGGRYDGRIAGDRRRPGRPASVVSSGANRGRETLASVESALSKATGSEPPVEIVVEADNNIELVSPLLEGASRTAQGRRDRAPPGSVEDEMRWLVMARV